MAYAGPADTTPLQKRQALENSKKQPSKLPKIVIGMMLTTTVIIDLTQFALDWIGIGEVINPVLDWTLIPLGFYIWFKTRGLDLSKARKTIAFLGGAFVDGLEASAIPLWTLDIGLVIFFEKTEEFAAAHADTIQRAANLAKTVSKYKGGSDLAQAANQVSNFTRRAQKDF